MKQTAIALALTLSVLCSTGCRTRQSYVYRPREGVASRLPGDRDMVHLGRGAAKALVCNLNVGIPAKEPILVASFVNVDDVSRSTTFGRLLSEQIGGEVANFGFNVKEMKLRRDSVFIQSREGEFLLSRDMKLISDEHQASAVIVGTYAVARDTIYVSARIVRVADNTIISGHNFTVPLGWNTRALLERSGELADVGGAGFE